LTWSDKRGQGSGINPRSQTEEEEKGELGNLRRRESESIFKSWTRLPSAEFSLDLEEDD